MKTQLRKPARERARYTEEYKQEALELWRNSGRSAAKVAAELGIRAPLLYRWARPKRESNLSKAGWSWGCVSTIDTHGRTIWIADAHRDDGRRYVVHADERLRAFMELEEAVGGPRSACKARPYAKIRRYLT
jgi:hypothetical protein